MYNVQILYSTSHLYLCINPKCFKCLHFIHAIQDSLSSEKLSWFKVHLQYVTMAYMTKYPEASKPEMQIWFLNKVMVSRCCVFFLFFFFSNGDLEIMWTSRSSWSVFPKREVLRNGLHRKKFDVVAFKLTWQHYPPLAWADYKNHIVRKKKARTCPVENTCQT